MNIFKSLSQGHGSISETNITSFLSYLLNSTNELDNSFILLFLGLIDHNLATNKIADKLNLKQDTLRERIINFNQNYSVSANPEFAIVNGSTKQIADVLITITDKNENDLLYLIIENKIKVFSANKLQVSKQYECFINSKDYQKHLPVYSVLITTDYDSFSPMHSSALDTNPNSVWLRWTNKKDKENSIETILRRLLMLEHNAEIHPINPNSQFILKSFIDYIVTEYSNFTTGQKNFSFNGSNEVENAIIELDNYNYVIRRYENKMIRVFDVNENLLDVEVLPLLKKINEHYQLQIDERHSTGTPKNTQVFGREVLSAFNKIKDLIKDKHITIA